MPEPRVEVTQYLVTMFPKSSINSSSFDLTVERRAEGRWAVLKRGWCLNTDGDWDYEPMPSERGDGWLNAHRFDLDTALQLAKETAPTVTVNGMTAGECVKWEADRDAE